MLLVFIVFVLFASRHGKRRSRPGYSRKISLYIHFGGSGSAYAVWRSRKLDGRSDLFLCVPMQPTTATTIVAVVIAFHWRRSAPGTTSATGTATTTSTAVTALVAE
jgi:hypothetical protein